MKNSEENPFAVGQIVIHPQHGPRKILKVVADAQVPAVILENLLGAIPICILKAKIAVKKPS